VRKGDEGFIAALHAHAPAADRADKLALYGWLVGDWETTVTAYSPNGSYEALGEIHAGWILEGRAIQDVWTIPRADSSSASPFPVAGNWFGTTVRSYDPTIDAWRISWIDPATNAYRQQIGRGRGADIVQLGTSENGAQSRWSFIEITPASFRWLGESSSDEGATWMLIVEVRARRSNAHP
jgi:hypothetical protein